MHLVRHLFGSPLAKPYPDRRCIPGGRILQRPCHETITRIDADQQSASNKPPIVRTSSGKHYAVRASGHPATWLGVEAAQIADGAWLIRSNSRLQIVYKANCQVVGRLA